jgi:hypothetical protein
VEGYEISPGESIPNKWPFPPMCGPSLALAFALDLALAA